MSAQQVCVKMEGSERRECGNDVSTVCEHPQDVIELLRVFGSVSHRDVPDHVAMERFRACPPVASLNEAPLP